MRTRWSTYLLAGLLAISLAWGVTQARARRRVEMAVEAERQRALNELADGISNVEILLGKSLVLSSPLQSSSIFPDLWYQANSALSNLSRLPLSVLEVQRTARFLKQTADIAYMLGKKVGRGNEIGDKDWETMNALRGQAANLATQVREMQMSSLKQGLTWSRRPATSASVSTPVVDIVDGFRSVEKDMNKFPSLVYDGPFSDHIERRTPQGVTGKPMTAEEAISKALSFAPVPAGTTYTGKVRNEVAGKIPAYAIEVSPQSGSGPTFYIDVTRNGGHVVFMSSDRVPTSTALSLEEARARATDFVTSRGFTSLEPTYVVREHNSAFVLFVHKQDGVRIYADLVKVQVALDSGQISGFEALGYLMSHRQRTLPKPKITIEQGRERLNKRLKVTSQRLTLIPLENLEEILAYEYRGKLGATEFLIYVNALTGDEERILQIVPAGGGELAM